MTTKTTTQNTTTNSIYDLPGAFLELGLLNIEQGRADTAWQLVEQLRRERPDDKELAAIANRIMAKGIYDYHHPMLLDQTRNALYAEAIKRAAPGKIVLDIGTGTGLLAMIAAKAEAKQVIACEENVIMARTARQIIAANGLEDRITIHEVRSTELDRDRDLSGGAELVVSELFSCNFVSEGILPSLEHARTQLCAPGARFLPPKASIRVALAELNGFAPKIGTIEGFDLSKFDELASPLESLTPDFEGLKLRSDPADFINFEFAAASTLPMEGLSQIEFASHGGPINGLAQWLHIDFGDGLIYENAPGGEQATAGNLHWPVQFTPLSQAIETDTGDTITINGRHTRNLLLLWDEL